jgi:hypothetical protein
MVLTVNEQLVIEPLETPQVRPLANKPDGVLDSVTDESEGLNPLPDTKTVAPGGPAGGVREIVAVLVTVNVAEPTSEATTLPVAVTL